MTGKKIGPVSRPRLAHGRLRHPVLASGAVLALAAGICAADQVVSLSSASAAETYPTTIAAGYDHTCAIFTGRAYCWGENTYGELGSNSTVHSSAPVPVYTGGALSGVTLTQITVGNGYTCALASTGQAYCWGHNADGELGNSSTDNSSVPVAVTTSGVLAGQTLTQISAGEYAACGVSSAGAAYCWGQGTSGQLGNNLGTSSPAPVAVSTAGALSGTILTQVSAGGLAACALSSAGAAYCWGLGTSGQLGHGGTSSSNQPVTVLASGVTFGEISVGYDDTCALSTAGAAYCWGFGSDGELGDGGSRDSGVPMAVLSSGVLSGLTLSQIATGDEHTCVLSATGAAYCWGTNHDGQLGDGSTAGSGVPVAVSPSGAISGRTLTQITAGQYQTCALDSAGTRYCWGLNSSGQLGQADTGTNFDVPVMLATSLADTITAGYGHSCDIRHGLAYCWGDNTGGELGNGSTIGSTSPVAVYTGGVLAGVTLIQITAGNGFTCALSASGAAYCWGRNADGELGDGTTTNSSLPVEVSPAGALAGQVLTGISAGEYAMCGLSSAGAAYCWGQNSSGQLGDNSVTSSPVPVAVTTSGVLSGIAIEQVDAGGAFACALSTAGTAYCWGQGGSGQLGDGSTATSSEPMAVEASGVLSGASLAVLTVGFNHACATAGTGADYCWGDDTYGELGDNTATSTPQDTPVAVYTGGALSGKTVARISAGDRHTCALDTSGLAYCWGENHDGQLGNGSASATSAAVAVSATGVLSGKNITQIAPGQDQTCALDSTGAAYCWGLNSSGQAGNPATSVHFPVPAAVTTDATMVASGSSHSCLLRNGKAFCWGDDSHGELGNGTTTSAPQTTPVPVSTSGVLSGVTLTQITAGRGFTCALSRAGAAYCWGAGSSGQLGNRRTSASDVPVAVRMSGALAGQTLTQISAGTNFVCALSRAGTGYCWGANRHGQLGNGGTTPRSTPGAVTTTGTPLAEVTLTEITAGTGYTCALGSTGAAYCWGLNSHGQLGVGSISVSPAYHPLATAVRSRGTPLAGVTLTQISAGTAERGSLGATCAVSSEGAAYCWGAGGSGQLGNGTTTTSQDTAVAVAAGGALSGVTVIQVTVGTSFACALGAAGAAYCWGLGTGDQLGNGAAASASTPVAVTTSGVLAGAALFQVSSGQLATCAQDATGAFYCWGGNSAGQLGNGSSISSSVPVTVSGIVPGMPTSITAFPGDTTATVYWTAPTSLGTGTLTSYTATASPGGASCSTTRAVSCTISGLANGTTYTVTVVTGTTAGDSAPAAAATVTPWPADTAISAGRASACIISRGSAYCWGDDAHGELGNGTTTATPQLSPVAVHADGVLSGVTLTQVVASDGFSCALSTAGVVYCWGAGGRGQLGDGADTSSNVPVAVTAATGSPLHHARVTQIAAGRSSACALSIAGAVYCWGAGGRGQLGDGADTSSNVPVAVTAATGSPLHHVALTQITAGGSSACALSTAGNAYCWGAGGRGQLGNRAHISSNVPVAVTAAAGTPLHDVILSQLSAGTDFVCALSAGGAAYCWGAGGSGQLGNDTTIRTENVPAAGTATTGTPLDNGPVTQIAAGAAFTCVLSTMGTAYCWGLNSSGQLGDNSTTQEDTAVLVGPQAPTGVIAMAGYATIAVSWTAPAFLNNGTLTGYTASATPGTASCTTTSLAGCMLTGLTGGTRYRITVLTAASTGTSAPSRPATAQPTGVSLTSPGSLTWNVTGSGADQSVVDAVPGDQQLTVDGAGTGASWHITVSASTFTSSRHTLPDAGAVAFTGSVTSLAGHAPSTTCAGSCVPPADITTYPVSISTAASSPEAYTVYDSSTGTGEGVMTLGGSSAAHPIGWWVQIPAAAYTGSYTSAMTVSIVSGP